MMNLGEPRTCSHPGCGKHYREVDSFRICKCGAGFCGEHAAKCWACGDAICTQCGRASVLAGYKQHGLLCQPCQQDDLDIAVDEYIRCFWGFPDPSEAAIYV